MMVGVLIHDEGPLRVLSISNPSRRNALTRKLLEELVRALPVAAAGDRQPIRCVVLSGDPTGGAFSSGYDIGRIDEDERALGLDPIKIPADAIESCPVPVLAAIDGPCMGGALELAMACTLRIASTNSTLAMPPARLGLVYSATGLTRFLRASPPSRVQHIFLTGDRLTAEEARRDGLVDMIVAEGGALSRAKEIATTMAANAPLAISGLLDAIRRLSRFGGPTRADFDAIDEARARTVASEDLLEGVAAFVEKRPARFRGR